MWMREGKTSPIYFICFAAMLFVVQLVFAGGHIHFAGFQGEHAQVEPLYESGDNSPGKQHPGHIDFCPLCWGQAAAGSLLLPRDLVLPHPTQICCAQFTVSGHLAERIPPAAFEPRGPPSRS